MSRGLQLFSSRCSPPPATGLGPLQAPSWKGEQVTPWYCPFKSESLDGRSSGSLKPLSILPSILQHRAETATPCPVPLNCLTYLALYRDPYNDSRYIPELRAIGLSVKPRQALVADPASQKKELHKTIENSMQNEAPKRHVRRQALGRPPCQDPPSVLPEAMGIGGT